MSSARSASATTSLPKPAALTPAGIGRSRDAIVASLAGCFLRYRVWRSLLDPAVTRPCGGWRHPTGSRALTQPRQHLEAGVTVGRLHADLALEGENSLDRVAAGAAIDAVGLETAFIETALDFHDLRQR